MAILTPSQLQAASNATYFDNVSGSITPATVRTLNDNWISSSILVDQTSSMSVGSSVSASYAVRANTALTATSSLTATSASYSVTSSLPLDGVVSATALGSSITFTKGDATTFSVTLSQTGSIATASLALNSELLDGLDSTSFATTSSLEANYATKSQVTSSVSVLSGSVQVSQNALSSSLSSRVSSLESFSSSLDTIYATDASVTASINVLSGSVQASQLALSSSVSTRFGLAPTLAGNNTFTGNNVFGNITASSAQVTSASIEYLTVIYETASVIYSSGSNQFGDATEDVQTLYGTVDIKTGPLLVTGSARVTGSLTMAGLSPINVSHVKANDVQGVEILTNSSATVATFGAGGGTGVTVVGQVNAASFAGSGSGVVGVVTSSFARTASYVNPLNQDVLITGSAILKPNLDLTEYPFTIFQASNGTGSLGNLISTSNVSGSTTGSLTISGSQNIILLSAGGSNTFGSGNGFSAASSIITQIPFVSGSNGIGHSRPLPTIINSVVNRQVIVTDNRPTTSTTPLTIGNSSLNSQLTLSTSTGSVQMTFSNLVGLSTILTVTGSNGTTKTLQGIGVIGNTNSLLIDSPTGSASYNSLLIGGSNNTVLVSGSNTTMQGVSVMGYQLRATGSAVATTEYGSLYAGRWNAIDNTAFVKETAFAVGTGATNITRRTSFHVSSSGLTTVRNGIEITGSVNGFVTSASIASSTSSLDFSQGNFYTSLVSGSTFFNITNPEAGQTVNLLLTTDGVATASFSSNVKQVSGSAYTPTSGSGRNDVLTFISFDGSSVYLANVKNLV